MERFDDQSAECFVLTYKAGLLSPVAHDLKIRVTHFEIQMDQKKGTVLGHADAMSLRVVSAMKQGVPDEEALTEKDKADIEKHIVNDVLQAMTYPQISFVSSAIISKGPTCEMEGMLTLHGKTRKIFCSLNTEGQRQIFHTKLHQPDFGIKPFSAMLGALKIQPDVDIFLSLFDVTS